jgi:hypothetical protein
MSRSVDHRLVVTTSRRPNCMCRRAAFYHQAWPSKDSPYRRLDPLVSCTAWPRCLWLNQSRPIWGIVRLMRSTESCIRRHLGRPDIFSPLVLLLIVGLWCDHSTFHFHGQSSGVISTVYKKCMTPLTVTGGPRLVTWDGVGGGCTCLHLARPSSNVRTLQGSSFLASQTALYVRDGTAQPTLKSYERAYFWSLFYHA